MSTRYNNGSHYENHQRAAELHDAAAHAHRAAAGHGQQEHLTDHELTLQALERSREAHRHSQEVSNLPVGQAQSIEGSKVATVSMAITSDPTS